MTYVSKQAAAAALFLLTASAAPAADLGHPVTSAPQPYPTSIAAYAFTWTGAYVGANIGGDIANLSLPDYVGSGKSTAFTGGLQAGYLWQVNQIVYGLEADVDYGWNKRSNTFTATDDYSQKDTIDWSTSVRGRLGYAFDRLLVYGTGGVTFANTKTRLTDTTASTSVSSEGMRAGWTLGAGLEYAVTNNVSIRGEYLYTDYGHYNVVGQRHSLNTDTFRVGVNYKF